MGAAVLALDIGGTKIATALVEAGRIVERHEIATPGKGDAEAWLGAIVEAAARWRGRYEAVGAAVTGLVDDGRWSALNPATLPIPAGFPLEAELSRRLSRPARAWNDAQAAAWAEYRQSADAHGQTMVFATISTGIGGGIVANGRLMTGLAGHFGQWRLDGDPAGAPAEAIISGRWIAEQAAGEGRPVDARAVFQAFRAGEGWAEAIVRTSAERAAALLLNIHLTLDPMLIVIGGGIGLAAGYLDLLAGHIEALPARLRPRLEAARLGADAGLIGAADLMSLNAATERV